MIPRLAVQRFALRFGIFCLLAALASGQGGGPTACEAARAHIPGTFGDCRVVVDADVRGQRTSLVPLWNAADDPLGRYPQPHSGISRSARRQTAAWRSLR